MLNNPTAHYAEKLKALAVFRGILSRKAVRAFAELLEEPSPCRYGGFLSELYVCTDNFSEYLLEAVTEDENSFMLRLAACEEVPSGIEKAAKAELSVLQEISRITSAEIREAMGADGVYAVAEWKTSDIDFYAAYTERMAELSSRGYGIFAKYRAFTLKGGRLVPVKNPDPIRLSGLTEYGAERGKVIANTLALLNDKPAANVLLYGDAGTGKSSTVKAVANEFAGRGLRLIEINKSQFKELPDIIEKIAKNPLKFIIFADDISFSSDDAGFSSLKAILEGSVSAKTRNMVIYATSNRRHLVKERFSDRDGDDMHAADTMEEMISLSERFGLKVAFLKPDKDTYLKIVSKLAKEYGVPVNPELLADAEAFALRCNGRSGRTAKHFIASRCCE